ncbi:MAG: MFS transporter [Limisphaerales bacterium]
MATHSVHVRLHTAKLKGGAFALEAINSLATTYFFYYAYFLAEKQFGFKTLQNLLLAAGLGLTYVGAAIYGGRFAQRHGYFYSVRVGVAILTVSFAVGAFVANVWLWLLILFVANFGLSFTWPALEAMVSEGEPRHRMQSMVGIYNFTWAGAGAVAYFTGGAMIEHLGIRSLYLVPAGLLVFEFALALFLEKELKNTSAALLPASDSEEEQATIAEKHTEAGAFLKMAWVANPFAYLGCNTVIAIIPTLAHKMQLSPMIAGFTCSIWLFVRAGSFVVLRFWPNWHYKFHLLVAAYVAMIAAFAVILLVPNLLVLIGAQVVFGLAHGLIYYSSLFYSMDVGETKGEHSGIHEAVIGAGNGGGPAIAALAIWLWPQHPSSGAWSVVGLLLVGLAIIFWLRPMARREPV